MTTFKHGISLLILTWNEENRLRSCLSSVRGQVDEIIAVDSHSTDGTLDVLKEHGAKIISADFKGSWSELRNIGLDAATYDWRFILDADERLDNEVYSLLRQLIERQNVDCFCFNRRNILDGTLTHYPDYHYRLFREYCRYEGKMHEALNGMKFPPEYLNVHIIHEKTWARQREQNERYRKLEGKL